MRIATPGWTARIWLEYRAGNVTRAERDCLLTLHSFRRTGGHCMAEPRHPGGAGQHVHQDSPTRPGTGQGARACGVGREARPGRLAVAQDVQPLSVPDASGGRPAGPTGTTLAGSRHYRTPGLRRGESKQERGSRRDATGAAAMPDLLAMRRAVIEARLGQARYAIRYEGRRQ